MADVNFKTLALQQLYTGAAGGAGTALMNTFRSSTDQTFLQDLDSLESRMAAFENVLIDTLAKAGTNQADYPYDRESLKKEFMEEVLALLLAKSDYRQTFANATIAGVQSTNVTVVDANNLLRDVQIIEKRLVTYSDGSTAWVDTGNVMPSAANFSKLSIEQHKQMLNASGDTIYDQYSALIDAIFAEGDKLKNNPVDPSTNAIVTANVVTSIKEVTVSGVTFNGVTTINGLTYLVEKGASTYNVTKESVNNQATQPVDFRLGFDGVDVTPTRYIRCDANGVPIGTLVVTLPTQRNLSPMQYLYYFTEARIKILRAQLAFKEAVVNEIRDDLLDAQGAYSDLEKQAGGARDRSEDGKTLNPNRTAETTLMDFWEARASKPSANLLDTGDDEHNYTQWASNRSSVKNYIDMKSTQSQDAMLDYQTTLNRYNSAYEVMSKLQEKMDGLVKSQLRNIA